MATGFESTQTPPAPSDARGRQERSAGRDGRRRSLISGQAVNVSDIERLASLATGAALVLQGLRNRSLMGLLVAGVGGGLVYRGATGHSMVYDALEIDTASGRAGTARAAQRGIQLTQSMLIDKPPEDLYACWRNLEELPTIMTHIESIRVIDDRRSHWVARAWQRVGGRTEWDAEIVDEQPNKRIAWRSLPGSIVVHRGAVEFLPTHGKRGTAVRVEMEYVPPAGKVGRLAAKAFGKALSRQVREDLRNFKRTMEVGEVVSIEGQPQGSCLGAGKRSGEWRRR